MLHWFEFFEHLNLALEKDLIDLVFEHSEIDDFDGDALAVLIMSALVHMAGVSLADDIIESVWVPLDLLASEAGRHAFFFGK